MNPLFTDPFTSQGNIQQPIAPLNFLMGTRAAPAQAPQSSGYFNNPLAQGLANPNVGHAGSTNGPQGGFGSMSPAEQAGYYSQNPNMAALTQALQTGFGYTSLAQLQNKLDPTIQAQQSLIAMGIDPTGQNYVSGLQNTDPNPQQPSQNGGYQSFNSNGGGYGG